MDADVFEANEKLREAQRHLLAVVNAKFPKHSKIKWRWNGHPQSGTVLWINDCWWSSVDIRVKNDKTGRPVSISLSNQPEQGD